jgi:hypothetical protein
MKTAVYSLCHLFDRSGLGQPRGAFDKNVAIGQQGEHQFVDQVSLANDLLSQPSFQLREELIIHRSGLFLQLSQKWRHF